MGAIWYCWKFQVHSIPQNGCNHWSKELCYLPKDVYPEVPEAFEELVHMADAISDKSMEMTEYFVVLVHCRTSDPIETMMP